MKTYEIQYQKNGLKKLEIKTDDLSKEILPSNVISIKEKKEKSFKVFNKGLDKKRINYLFYELSLMLEANIVLVEAFDILIENEKDDSFIKFLKILKSSFSNNINLETSLKEFKVDFLIVSFFKLCKDSGNIKENIKALSVLLFEIDSVKKRFYKAIQYPLMLIFTLLLSFFSIFYFVLPKLKMLFINFENQSFATKSMFFVEMILKEYFYLIFFFFPILLLLVFSFLKKHKKFIYILYEFINEKLFLFRDIYKSMNYYKMFLIMDILLKSKYEFHYALKFSKVLLKDKYLLDKISLIENLLENGKSISYSFSKANIFDDIVLNLINSAQKANTLDFAIEKIKDIYKNRFNEKIDKLLSLIEPTIIILIVSLILWLVLAIFVPLWDSSNVLGM